MGQQIMQFILNHWELWLAFLTLIILVLINEYFTQRQMPNSLSTAEAVAAMNHDHAVVIDLRDKESFSKGHIIGAVRLERNEEKKLEKYKTTPLILVCARGVESSALGLKLKKQGFTKAMTLSGGIAAWQTDNLPLIKKKQK